MNFCACFDAKQCVQEPLPTLCASSRVPNINTAHNYKACLAYEDRHLRFQDSGAKLSSSGSWISG
jgi:hypothetical protein